MRYIEETEGAYEAPNVEVFHFVNSSAILTGTNTVVGPDPEYPD
jgi:hypothetical protein